MKILGHIHTFNDDAIIDQSLKSLLDQTYPMEEIIIVDNASSDDTLNRTFPDKVKVIRHTENIGTNGSVITGFKYAMEHHYDWIWVFDADSAPRPDALEVLVDLYKSFSPEQQERVSFLGCLPLDNPDMEPRYGIVFTQTAAKMSTPEPPLSYCECDVTIWSGALYQMKSVRKIGLPTLDYILDWGEFEYGYRAMRAGFKGYMHEKSIMHHNIKGQPSMQTSSFNLGPISLKIHEFPPIRCYYLVRNILYFWIYDNKQSDIIMKLKSIFRVVKFIGQFLLRPKNHGPHIVACFRGLWNGLTKNIKTRF